MLRTIDPLDYLRKNIKQSKNIIREGDNLIFEDGVKLPLNAQSALMSANHKEKHYTLGSLWLFLKFKENLKDYMTEAHSQKIEFIEPLDREKIIEFFIKDMDNIDILDNEIRPKTLITLGKKTKGTHLDIFYKNKNAKPEDAKKKEKYMLMQKQQELKDKNLCIMDYIYAHEKKKS